MANIATCFLECADKRRFLQCVQPEGGERCATCPVKEAFAELQASLQKLPKPDVTLYRREARYDATVEKGPPTPDCDCDDMPPLTAPHVFVRLGSAIPCPVMVGTYPGGGIIACGEPCLPESSGLYCARHK